MTFQSTAKLSKEVSMSLETPTPLMDNHLIPIFICWLIWLSEVCFITCCWSLVLILFLGTFFDKKYGNFSEPEDFEAASKTFQTPLQIDYIRVYQIETEMWRCKDQEEFIWIVSFKLLFLTHV